jgi:hypothetical protein
MQNLFRRSRWRESAWLPAAGLTAIAYALIRPWGDFPLNDDWIFSRVARRFAETGVFLIDHDRVSPACAAAVHVARRRASAWGHGA